MREQVGPILKALCLVLAALLLYQIVQVARRANPLSHVAIPALPRLASDTNDLALATNSIAAKSSSNVAAQIGAGTNAVAAKTPTNAAGTNVAATKSRKAGSTNAVASEAAVSVATNLIEAGSTNASALAAGSTNLVEKTNELRAELVSEVLSNSSVETKVTTETPSKEIAGVEAGSTDSATTNLLKVTSTNLVAEVATNISMAADTNVTRVSKHSTNLVVLAGPNATNAISSGTNFSKKAKSKSTNGLVPPGMAGMNMGPGAMRGGGKPAELPPDIKARVDRIYESELFGQVMHPMPMALLGIAGNTAFLRSPSGQTGLVKEGDSLGELKLLRIGINRVLVEQDGNKSELMIFNGYGGESLMPKEKDTAK